MSEDIAFIRAVLRHIPEDHLAPYAAALAYSFLFALFPLLLFLAALLGLLHVGTLHQVFSGPVATLVPQRVRGLIFSAIHRAGRFDSPSLLSVGVLGFMTATSSALRQMVQALNAAYSVEIVTRKAWQTMGLSIGLGTLMGCLLAFSQVVLWAGTSLVQAFLVSMFHTRIALALASAIRWGVFFVLIWVLLSLMYNWLPDKRLKFRWVLPGTLVVVLLWIVMSLGYSFYASHFSHYSETYGSLGAVILLMLYLYILSFALLIGGVVNALWLERTLERRRPQPAVGRHG